MSAPGRRAVIRWAVALVSLTAIPLLWTAPAEGHAFLETSTPADGTELDAAPEAVTLSFTEAPDASLSTVRVIGEGGVELQAAAPAPAGPRALEVPVRPLEEGAYSVTWRVVSEVDGHPSAGVFSFGVGVPASAVPGVTAVPEQPPTSPLEIVARILLFAGLGALLGAAVTGTVAFDPPPTAATRLAFGGTLVGLAGIGLLALAQRSAAAVGFGQFVGTPIGRALVWRALLGLLALIAVLIAMRSRRFARLALEGAAVAAGVALYIHVASGHAAAEGGATIQVLGQWSHVIAAAVWLGGLAALVAALRGEPQEEKSRAARRFSAAAVVALAVVFVTGVVRSLDEVGSIDALFSTGYGQLVLLKVGLILVLAALGAVNRYRNVRRLDQETRSLRRIGRIELVLAVVAIAAAGGLASLIPPASIPAAADRPAAIEVAASDFATSVRATLEVDPGVPGQNRFLLRVEDFDSGEPVAADAVTLRFTPVGRPEIGETSLALPSTDEDGVYEAAGSNLSTSGPWGAVAVIQRGADAVEVPFELATLCETQTVEGQGDEPTIHLFEPPTGGSTEGYIIPLGGGRTEIHFTFIDPSGAEQRVDDISITAFRPGEGVRSLEPLQLTKGHYLAEAELDPGEWRFDSAITTATGEPASGCFEETLGG